MSKISKQEYEKQRNIFSFLVVVPRILAIFHFVGQIILQYSIKLSPLDSSLYIDSYASLGRVFSSSSLTARCLSGKYDLKLIYSSSAVVSIALGLVHLFCSFYSARGKGRYLLLSMGIEAVDLLLLIPCILISFKGTYPLKRSLTDDLINGIVHLISVGLLIYSQFVVSKIHNYEVAQGEIKE